MPDIINTTITNLRHYDIATTLYKTDNIRQAQYMLKALGFNVYKEKPDGTLSVSTVAAIITSPLCPPPLRWRVLLLAQGGEHISPLSPFQRGGLPHRRGSGASTNS
jgi:hypothetical protein